MAAGERAWAGAFTLVETVVAAAVAAIAMTMAAAALFGGHALLGRLVASSPKFENSLAFAAAMEKLREDVACALPAAKPSGGEDSADAPRGAAGGSGGALFAGTEDTLRLMRLVPLENGVLAPVFVEWTRHASGGAVRLVSASPFSPAAGEILARETFPALWGTPHFEYRSACFDGSGACVPHPWKGDPSTLPGAVEVLWGSRKAVFPVFCFQLEEENRERREYGP